MSNWALVIGIDQYWTPNACLNGAVRDALRLREWLLSPSGGAVDPQNLLLGLGPAQNQPPPPISYGPVTKDGMVQLIDRLIQKSGGSGQRLYVYFAGHGLTARGFAGEEQALVATDFTDRLTDNCLSLRSVLEFFKATNFADQFFFVDACRNMPWQEFFEIGRMPRPRQRDPGSPPVQQFVCCATSAGVKAAEVQLAGREGGAFTAALLDGLAGAVRAKAYDADRDLYVVRWNALTDYVRKTVSERRISFGPAECGLIQVPRVDGERGSATRESDPILTEIDPTSGALVPELLQVTVDPAAVLPEATIKVYEVANPTKPTEVRSGPASQPLEFRLAPREYVLVGEAPGYSPRRRRSEVVAVYEPVCRTVEFVPASGAPGGPPPLPMAPVSGRSAVLALEAKGATGDLAGLTIKASDPLAHLECLDMSGRVLAAVYAGELKLGRLRPGAYRARLRTPEGHATEESIHLAPGANETVELAAPGPVAGPILAQLVGGSQLGLYADQSLEVSELAGPIAAAESSTVLLLAGIMNLNGGRMRQLGYGRRLGLLGFHNPGDLLPRKALSGLHLILADEDPSAGAGLDLLSVRCWPVGSAPPPRAASPVAAGRSDLADLTLERAPGPHWVSFELPQRPPVVFALVLLRGHLTFLVVHRRANADVHVFLYYSPLPAVEVDEPELRHMFHDARRLELIQRLCLRGRYDEVGALADPRQPFAWGEPAGQLLSAYLALRGGGLPQAAKLAQRLASDYPALADPYVIRAECDPSDARRGEAYQQAMDRGLPVFVGGLGRLLAGVRRLGLRHPNLVHLEAVERSRVPGLLWTAVAVESIEALAPMWRGTTKATNASAVASRLENGSD